MFGMRKLDKLGYSNMQHYNQGSYSNRKLENVRSRLVKESHGKSRKSEKSQWKWKCLSYLLVNDCYSFLYITLDTVLYSCSLNRYLLMSVVLKSLEVVENGNWSHKKS